MTKITKCAFIRIIFFHLQGMAQQYSYGYGYGYAQPAAGYGVQMPGYGTAAAAAVRPPQQAYQVASYTPKPHTTATPQPQQGMHVVFKD